MRRATLIGRVLNDYDEAGKRIRSTTHTFALPQPRTWITTYEYDSLGNWIKEETTEQSSSSQPAKAFTIPIIEETYDPILRRHRSRRYHAPLTAGTPVVTFL